MRFLEADRIFDGKTYLADDSVLVLDEYNKLKEVVSKTTVDGNNVERLKGILTPGFVNAHCHLELSHLAGEIPQHLSLPGFAKQVITCRNNFTKEDITASAEKADKDMWKNGIVAVGDISNGDDSFQTKRNSGIYYHTFIELIGLNPSNAPGIFEKGIQLLKILTANGLKGSLAPHAPYSTSSELINLIAQYDEKSGFSFSIHNQESDHEDKFFNGVENGFYELYKFLNLDISWFVAPKTSSLRYYGKNLSAKNSILVHNTVTKSEDIEFLSGKTIFWCFCPGANLYIENVLPDFSLFAHFRDTICIGTDSLASNTGLDLIKETNIILKQSKVFTEENMLQAITSNGAKALGISDSYGQLIPGKNTGLNLVEFDNASINFIKKIN